MNTLSQLAALLDGFGLPWSNGGTRDGDEQSPPYIDIEAGFGESIGADNGAWLRYMPYDVALYVRERDYDLERRLEAALDDGGFPFVKTVTLLDSEALVETSYEVNITEE